MNIQTLLENPDKNALMAFITPLMNFNPFLDITYWHTVDKASQTLGCTTETLSKLLTTLESQDTDMPITVTWNDKAQFCLKLKQDIKSTPLTHDELSKTTK